MFAYIASYSLALNCDYYLMHKLIVYANNETFQIGECIQCGLSSIISFNQINFFSDITTSLPLSDGQSNSMISSLQSITNSVITETENSTLEDGMQSSFSTDTRNTYENVRPVTARDEQEASSTIT